MIDQTMVTTNIELNGYKVTRNLGVVRGITVRSRSLFGNIAGGLQTLVGGKISIYVELCEKTREEAFRANAATCVLTGARMQSSVCGMMQMK